MTEAAFGYPTERIFLHGFGYITIGFQQLPTVPAYRRLAKFATFQADCIENADAADARRLAEIEYESWAPHQKETP